MIAMGHRDLPGAEVARPALHVETLVLLVAIFLVLAANDAFWRGALAGRSWADPTAWGFAAAVFAGLTASYIAVGTAVSGRHTVRPLLTLVLLVSAAADHFSGRYGTYFDTAMLRNVLATDYNEARDLLGWDLGLHMLILGVLPSILVCWPQLKRRTIARSLLVRLAWMTGAVVLAAGSLLLVFGDFSSLMRNNRQLRHLITPGNIVAAAARNAWGRAKRPNEPKLPVAADAALGPAWKGRSRPTLFVLVVGETARAQNFSLGGYRRETNPELARRDVIYFPNATACGTSTEVSLPCMFSPFGRRGYDEEKIVAHESLLHVLARAGFNVLWRDNQSGCKGVCDGLPVHRLDGADAEGLCANGECLDEVLLQGMEGIAHDRHGNLFVVMHQLGSHGPAYFQRYPPSFKRFTPACETAELRRCTEAEIVNAYDNSLLYTDHFLAKVIAFLADAQKTHDTAMLYVSDHGESLGEGGLYLHGVPYAIAPDVQTNVPFAMWLSPAFQRGFGVSRECMGRQTALPVSHDNLFHSVLGVLDVATAAYDARLDLFAACRARIKTGY
jgi:lipid A ethanolaminephosphotransferase